VASGVLEADPGKESQHLFHHWRGVNGAESYDDVPGFCKIRHHRERFAAHGPCSRPGRYVGAEEVEDDRRSLFEVKMTRELVAEMEGLQYAAGRRKLEPGGHQSQLRGWVIGG